MKSIIVTPVKDKDLKFLSALLTKLGYKPHVLDQQEKEDYALLKNMLEDRKGDYVTEDEINEILNR
jgi:hypothetical protein